MEGWRSSPHLIPLLLQPSCWPWARRASTAAASTRNVMRWPITCGAASTEGAGGAPLGPPRGPLDLQGSAGAARDQQDPISHLPVTPQSPLPAAIKCPCGESLWVWNFWVLWGDPRCVAGPTGCGSALHPGWRSPPRIPGSKGAAVPQGDKVHDGAGVTPQHLPHDAPLHPPRLSGGKTGAQRLYWRAALTAGAALAAGEKAVGGPGSSWRRG